MFQSNKDNSENNFESINKNLGTVSEQEVSRDDLILAIEQPTNNSSGDSTQNEDKNIASAPENGGNDVSR